MSFNKCSWRARQTEVATLTRTHQRAAKFPVAEIVTAERKAEVHVTTCHSLQLLCQKICQSEKETALRVSCSQPGGCLQYGGKETIFWHDKKLATLTENQTGHRGKTLRDWKPVGSCSLPQDSMEHPPQWMNY